MKRIIAGLIAILLCAAPLTSCEGTKTGGGDTAPESTNNNNNTDSNTDNNIDITPAPAPDTLTEEMNNFFVGDTVYDVQDGKIRCRDIHDKDGEWTTVYGDGEGEDLLRGKDLYSWMLDAEATEANGGEPVFIISATAYTFGSENKNEAHFSSGIFSLDMKTRKCTAILHDLEGHPTNFRMYRGMIYFYFTPNGYLKPEGGVDLSKTPYLEVVSKDGSLHERIPIEFDEDAGVEKIPTIIGACDGKLFIFEEGTCIYECETDFSDRKVLYEVSESDFFGKGFSFHGMDGRTLYFAKHNIEEAQFFLHNYKCKIDELGDESKYEPLFGGEELRLTLTHFPLAVCEKDYYSNESILCNILTGDVKLIYTGDESKRLGTVISGFSDKYVLCYIYDLDTPSSFYLVLDRVTGETLTLPGEIFDGEEE